MVDHVVFILTVFAAVVAVILMASEFITVVVFFSAVVRFSTFVVSVMTGVMVGRGSRRNWSGGGMRRARFGRWVNSRARGAWVRNW